mgnify:CR=1 FL=1
MRGMAIASLSQTSTHKPHPTQEDETQLYAVSPVTALTSLKADAGQIRMQASQPVHRSASKLATWAKRVAGPGLPARCSRASAGSSGSGKAARNSARRCRSGVPAPRGSWVRRSRALAVSRVIGGSPRSASRASRSVSARAKPCGIRLGQVLQSPMAMASRRPPRSQMSASASNPRACRHRLPPRRGQSTSTVPSRPGWARGTGTAPSSASAPVGQAAAQAPQPVQAAASMSRSPSSPKASAATGQAATQAVQLTASAASRTQAPAPAAGCRPSIAYQLSASPGTKGRSAAFSSASRAFRSASRAKACDWTFAATPVVSASQSLSAPRNASVSAPTAR